MGGRHKHVIDEENEENDDDDEDDDVCICIRLTCTLMSGMLIKQYFKHQKLLNGIDNKKKLL